jgi:hypothetical protein
MKPGRRVRDSDRPSGIYTPVFRREQRSKLGVLAGSEKHAVQLGSMHRLLRITSQRRAYASISNANINQPFVVFDRNMKRIQRDRAASKNEGEDSRVVDYLRNEVADRMIERLLVSTSLVTLCIHLTLVGHQTYLQVYSRRRRWTRTFLALDRIKTNK